MSVAGNKTKDEVAELGECIKDTLRFLHDIEELGSDSVKVPMNLDNQNGLELAFEMSNLIRTHSTKLSLLILNPPVKSSTILRALRELTTNLIPRFIYSVNICKPTDYSQLFSREIKHRASQILNAIKKLIEVISSREQPLGDKSFDDGHTTVEKTVLSKSGAILESCDAIKQLRNTGIAGFTISTTENYIDLIKDALEELQEWAKEEDFDEWQNRAEENSFKSNTFHPGSDNSSTSLKRIPSHDKGEIWQRLQLTQKKLRLLILMLQATIKRRLKTLPSLPNRQREILPNDREDRIDTVNTLDRVLDMMKAISNLVDELAGSFYDSDLKQIDKNMEDCFSLGSRIAGLLMNNWNGQPDGFSDWLSKFQKMIVSDVCLKKDSE